MHINKKANIIMHGARKMAVATLRGTLVQGDIPGHLRIGCFFVGLL